MWWKQAWDGWEERPVVGTGAGSFALTNLRYRTTFLDQATEPHNVPLQFLSETGVVGLALLATAFASLIVAGLIFDGFWQFVIGVIVAIVLVSLYGRFMADRTATAP